MVNKVDSWLYLLLAAVQEAMGKMQTLWTGTDRLVVLVAEEPAKGPRIPTPLGVRGRQAKEVLERMAGPQTPVVVVGRLVQQVE
jgi:hypothetical protein